MSLSAFRILRFVRVRWCVTAIVDLLFELCQFGIAANDNVRVARAHHVLLLLLL